MYILFVPILLSIVITDFSIYICVNIFVSSCLLHFSAVACLAQCLLCFIYSFNRVEDELFCRNDLHSFLVFGVFLKLKMRIQKTFILYLESCPKVESRLFGVDVFIRGARI